MAAAPQVQLDHVLRRAIGKVASDAFEVTVTDARAELVHPREDRDYVLRLTLDASEPLPNVILKRASRPYDPTAPALREPGGFFYEWVGLEFLSGAGAPVPRYLGGSREHGFVLMEDVGAAGDLADTLVSGSAKTAGEQLLAMADLLAELHGRAAGREAEYERLWRERASH